MGPLLDFFFFFFLRPLDSHLIRQWGKNPQSFTVNHYFYSVRATSASSAYDNIDGRAALKHHLHLCLISKWIITPFDAFHVHP